MPKVLNILGKRYLIEIFPKRFLKSKVIVENEKIIIILAEHQRDSSAKTILIQYLIKLARDHISLRAEYFANEFSLNYQKIAIREQKSRWGSCSSKGNLNFNWRLIFSDPEILDYVVIHELAHTKEMNHSKSFWQIVENIMPNYKIHQNWLKHNGKILFNAI